MSFKRKRNLFLVLCFAFFVPVIIYFTGRNLFLRAYIKSFEKQFSEKNNVKLTILDFSFNGLSTVVFSGISIVPENNDTLLVIENAKARLKPFSLILFKKEISDFEISGVTISLHKSKNKNNFSFLLNTPESNDKQSSSGFGKSGFRISERLFSLFPDYVNATNVQFSFADDSSSVQLVLEKLNTEDGKISGLFSAVDSGKGFSQFLLSGEINKKKKNISLNISSKNKTSSFDSFLKSKYDLSVLFDNLSLSIEDVRFSEDKLKIHGNFYTSGLKVKQPKLSPDIVHMNLINMNYSVTVGDNYFQLDSTSQLNINKISFSPSIKYQVKPEKYLSVKIKMPSIKANDFFSSLPYGMFYIVNNIKAEGSLSYALNFGVNLDKLDTVIFSSELKKEKFMMNKSSLEPITRVNQLFDHTVYEKGEPVRTFLVGAENPDFVPLMKISELLKNCVLTAEDGAFFYHRGFNEEMFAKAIADNIRKKKFARGASTITMQFVKNVYLSRSKTISRKLEEAMLVWLIENNRIISKERIFEIYLNIIEWGPGMYGIGEASHFYFQKKPMELSLEESIFLSSIIPSPKLFRYSFDKTGNLKGTLSSYYKLISGILLKREVITKDEYDHLRPTVKITGRAKHFILPADSVQQDTVIIEQMNLIK